MSRRTLIPVALLVAFVLAVVHPVSSSLVFYPSGSVATTYQVPLSLDYSIKVYNQSTVGNQTITKLVETSKVEYQAQLVNYTRVQVAVATNFTPIENFTPAKTGNYDINYVITPLTLEYPFIYPGFLSNSTSYGISTPNASIVLSYVNSTNVTLGGTRYTGYIYREFTPQQLSLIVLQNGVLYQENRTYNRLNFVLTLENFSLSSTLQTYKVIQNMGYLYSNLTYSSFSQTYQPAGYVEYVYPTEFPGGLLVSVVYQIQPFSSFPLGGFTSFSNSFVNFVINVGNVSQIPTNFVSVNGSTALWNGVSYTLVGSKSINLTNGTIQASVFKNVDKRGNVTYSVTYIYVSHGLLVEEDYNQTFPGSYAFKIVLMPNSYIDPNQHFPDVTGYYNSTLPYKPVHPTSAFVYTVLVTLLIVAILVILHRRL